MLQLKNIVKTYDMGDTKVEALKGVSLEFRKNEFISILGQSGCGKTTMLNIIGGLDKYTDGDLVINGISTKEYKDVDWDIYRNNSIGFVFQSYNLISHQSVYTNVELALTLAGVSHEERKRRVTEALEKVGLADQIHKKPTQMSGGQMQRVAIARALVNNPEILLADEPTGALDSETSVQIMELLKEIAHDRLVIMVTHNPSLAEEYSTRTIKLLDGRVIDDSDPYDSGRKIVKRGKKKRKKISMSFPTALSLSFKNLLTKKTRTILTAFAGSIGIIGIALILSLSNGMQTYVNNLERDTLSTYPLEIQSQTADMSGMISIMMDANRRDGIEHDLDMVYTNAIMSRMIETMNAQIQRNNMRELMAYIESDEGAAFKENTNTIQYRYGVELQVFKNDTSDILQVNPSEVFESFGGGMSGSSGMSMGSSDYMNVWSEMIDNNDILHAQYDVVAGKWAENYDELVLVLDSNNELSDMTLYSLGLLDVEELSELFSHAMRGEEYQTTSGDTAFTYDEILSLTYKLLLNTDYYVKENGVWVDKSEDTVYMTSVIENALELKIVGIIRPNENATAAAISGSVAYTAELTDYIINEISKTDIAKEQTENPEVNVFTGGVFDMDEYAETLTIEDVHALIEGMPQEEQMQIQMIFEMMSEEQILEMFIEQAKSANDKATYEHNIALLGIAEIDNPTAIRLYPKDFNSKKEIERLIDEYNTMQENSGNEDNVINYTDIVGMMTSSVSSIINIVSYVLIAFVSISLIVSSIMIAIITYISVLERTKEIGILRSIGASKKDITRVFNAETVIEGFVAGIMGVLVTILLNIPINAIIKSLTDISGVSALPIWGAIGLIVISVLLTVVAGFIPSKMAAKKDPVEALRTE